MAFLLHTCRSFCRPAADVNDAEQDLVEVQAEANVPVPSVNAQEDEEDGAAPGPLDGRLFGLEEEHRICPISGLSTLQGACPFAKPKAKAKDGGKKQKVSLNLDFKWEQGDALVSISVCAHHTEAFADLELPDSASKEDIKRQYRALSLKHHPDKNQDNLEEATEQFQRIKDAYQKVKDTDGEMAFPWDNHSDKQTVVTGDDAISLFAKVGMEACEEHHFKGLQLRHLVRTSAEVKVLKFETEKDEGRITECRLEALCLDSKSFVNHLVKVYRRDAWEYQEAEEGT
jgi:hypothetical protein